MLELLETLLKIDEDAQGLNSLYRIYKGQEKGLDPDPSDLFTALSMVKKYYKDYLDWYEEYADFEVDVEHLPIQQAYKKRLQEIQQALKSKDINQQMIALDNAVNQWHMDFPVIVHLGLEADGTEKEGFEFQNLADNIAKILDRLGRLPKESPYVKK